MKKLLHSLKKTKPDFELLSLALFIFLIPVMINTPEKPLLPPPLGGKIQLSEMAFVLLFLSWAGKIIREKVTFRFSFMYIPLMLYLCSSLISFKNSSNLTESIVEFVGILYLAALFILLLNTLRSKERFYFSINIWIIASVLVVSLGITGIILAYVFKLKTFLVREYTSFPYLGHIFRVYSTFMPNAKFLSSYLTIGTPLVFMQLVSSEAKREKLRWSVCLGLFLITFLFTFSRGWLSLAVCLYLISIKIQNPEVILKIFKYLLLTFIIVFGALIILISLWKPVDVSFNQFYDKEAQVVENVSMTDPEMGLRRIQIDFGIMDTHYFWLKKIALKMFREHPVVGIGLGTFRNEIIHLKSIGQLPEKFPSLDPHCTILGRAAESGMLGAISLIFLWGYIIKLSFHAYKVAPDQKAKLMAWTIFSITIAFAIQSVDMDIMNFRFVWFIFAWTGSLKRLFAK